LAWRYAAAHETAERAILQRAIDGLGREGAAAMVRAEIDQANHRMAACRATCPDEDEA
jgi:hypothetical protein